MTTQTILILIVGALFVHGVGHTLGFFKPARSWMLSALGEPAHRRRQPHPRPRPRP